MDEISDENLDENPLFESFDSKPLRLLLDKSKKQVPSIYNNLRRDDNKANDNNDIAQELNDVTISKVKIQ